LTNQLIYFISKKHLKNPQKRKRRTITMEIWDPFADFEQFRLKNGLSVYVLKQKRPWVAFGFVVHSGAREDPVNKKGLAHFTEHCVAAQISEDEERWMEEEGILFSPGTVDYLSSRFKFTTPLDDTILEKMLQIYGRMLLEDETSRFAEEKIVERERKIISEEIRRTFFAKSMLKLVTRRRRALFEGHRLASYCNDIGTLESVDRIKPEDVARFYKEHYTPQNISVVVVGGLNEEKVRKLLEESPFSMEKKGRRTPIAVPVSILFPLKENQYEIRSVDISDDSEKEEIEAVYYDRAAAIPGTISPEALRIFAAMLESALHKKVRIEHGLSYEFLVSWESFQDIFEAVIKGVIDPEGLNRIEEIIKECLEETRDNKSLFERFKGLLLKRIRFYDADVHSIRDSAMEDLAYEQRIVSMKEIQKRREAVEMKEIQEIAEIFLQRSYRSVLFK